MSAHIAQEHLNVKMAVNGEDESHRVEVRTTLAGYIREEVCLTGTKLGCEHGVCGSCTVLIDGLASRSCLTLAAQAEGSEITTVEGLSDGRSLNALQLSFKKHHALQCGFCTAGILVTATELLATNEPLNEASVRERLSGNLCRCTGYETIVDAILSVATSKASQ